jgi:hypothetical protein
MSYTEKSKTQKEKSACTVKKVVTPEQNEVSVQLKSENPTVRYLKLKAYYRESRSQLLLKHSPKVVPELRLCGNWLEEVGFFPNDYVSVTVMDGLLLIRSAQEHSSTE